jgi:hypothetical protein
MSKKKSIPISESKVVHTINVLMECGDAVRRHKQLTSEQQSKLKDMQLRGTMKLIAKRFEAPFHDLAVAINNPEENPKGPRPPTEFECEVMDSHIQSGVNFLFGLKLLPRKLTRGEKVYAVQIKTLIKSGKQELYAYKQQLSTTS